MPQRIIWSRYTGRWWGRCYIWYSEEGTGSGRNPSRPLLAVPNVTSIHQRSVYEITSTVLLLNNGPLLCGFNVPLKSISLTFVPHQGWCDGWSSDAGKIVTFSTATRRLDIYRARAHNRQHIFNRKYNYNVSQKNKKLTCRRGIARCFLSLNISLSHSRSLKIIGNDTLEKGVNRP